MVPCACFLAFLTAFMAVSRLRRSFSASNILKMSMPFLALFRTNSVTTSSA